MSDPTVPAARSRAALLAACALLGLVACRLGPRPPDGSVEPSERDSAAFRSIWGSALSAEGGELTVVFTEQQLTAFLASRITEAERPFIDRAQVHLRDGKIEVYGTSVLGPIEAGALLVVQPIVDSEGTVAFEITSAKLGPLPAPQTMMRGLSELLTEAFTGKLGPLATGIRITSLAIADGQVAIVGSLR